MKDFYYILGVDSNSALDEIKEAYRKLSKKFHPDVNQGDAYFEDRFKEINEAYETLSDPDKRYRYDEGLKQFKSKPASEGHKRQRYYYYENNEQRRRQTHRSAAIPKRRPGVGISVILILIALIVSIYIVESFSSSKKIKVKGPAVIAAIPNKPHKHHKRKHGLKSNGDSSAISQAVLKPAPASTVSSAKPAETVQDKQPLPSAAKRPDANGAYLYTAYVRANITGVINLREAAAYSSEVIATIPANAKVFVLQKGDAYDKVSYNNSIGYVPQWSIKTSK